MPCYHPLQGWRSKHVNASGKRSIVFDRSSGFTDLPVEVPCGQCVGCRLERSRQWAIRCVHEASLHDDNCFLTLTYNDDHLPEDGGLVMKHYQDFMKRLRKKYNEHQIRFFHCGEYGDLYKRPHYHACIFGFDFPDKKHFKTVDGYRLYISESLSELWPFGFATIGSLTFDSAAYVARYIMKKITISDRTPEHLRNTYERVDAATGEIHDVSPEYVTMSRRPGIGKGWFEKYSSDVYPKDFITVNGKKMRPPKFYDHQLDALDPDELVRIKAVRKHDMTFHAENNSVSRLQARETCHIKRAERLVRILEKE